MAADIFSEEQRSYVMSRVASKNTKPELVVRSYLHRKGFRFRIHSRQLPGNPDMVLPKHRTVILIHGCFWHRHQDCSRTTMPSSRVDFWRDKFEKNVSRDQKNQALLKQEDWRVLVVWECEISTHAKRDGRLPLLVQQIEAVSTCLNQTG